MDSSEGYVAQAFRRRELLWAFALRDIKIKYKQSVMGFLWAIFMPMLIVLAGIFVRLVLTQLSGNGVDRTAVASVAVKAVPWAFFVATMRLGTASLIGNSNLVSKIRFPKILFPLASMLSSLFDLCVASVVVAVALVLLGILPDAHVLWLPVLLGVLMLLVFGLTGLLSVANLFFRDVKYIVEVALTFAIFFTPVFYQASEVGRFERFLMLNPAAPILEGVSAAVVGHAQPPLAWLLYSLCVGAVLAAGTVAAFSSLEPRFAEYI